MGGRRGERFLSESSVKLTYDSVSRSCYSLSPRNSDPGSAPATVIQAGLDAAIVLVSLKLIREAERGGEKRRSRRRVCE